MTKPTASSAAKQNQHDFQKETTSQNERGQLAATTPPPGLAKFTNNCAAHWCCHHWGFAIAESSNWMQPLVL